MIVTNFIHNALLKIWRNRSAGALGWQTSWPYLVVAGLSSLGAASGAGECCRALAKSAFFRRYKRLDVAEEIIVKYTKVVEKSKGYWKYTVKVKKY